MMKSKEKLISDIILSTLRDDYEEFKKLLEEYY